MITFIAEKPSVGRDIAKVLGAKESRDGFLCGGRFRGEEACVTWAFGHLVDKVPCDADPGWAVETLPFIPSSFRLEPRKSGKDDAGIIRQLGVITALFAKSSLIVNCGDAGREGEVIQRYIYQYCCERDPRCRKPVERMWISSMTKEAIRESLGKLKPSSEYDNLFNAGDARTDADWLVGINCTRALSSSVKRNSDAKGKVYSLGRVQTPTLALVCQRYLDNKNFVPVPFWTLRCETSSRGTDFTVSGTVRYATFEKANSEQKHASVSMLEVTEYETTKRTLRPPLLYDLGTIQQDANRKYGIPVGETLQIIEDLYLRKLLTYPRTSSRYITPDLLPTIPDRLKALSGHPSLAEKAAALQGQTLNRRSVNADKVTDHHALLIEKVKAGQLTEKEQKIYDLVATRMIEAFSAPCEQEVTKAGFAAGGVPFRAVCVRTLVPGWKSVLGEKDCEKDENGEPLELQTFPPLNIGDVLPVKKVDIVNGKTKPKPLYTEGTLVAAMETAGKDSEDQEIRETLKDIGIGTPATRAGIIGTLIKGRGYLAVSSGKIVPTATGMEVFNLVKAMPIANVELTGTWEKALNGIERGSVEKSHFDTRIRQFTGRLTQIILSSNTSSIGQASMDEDHVKCPLCGGTMKIWDDNVKCGNKSCGLYVKRTVCGKKLAASTMKKLIETGRTGLVKGLHSQSTGKTFDACLVFSTVEKDGRRYGNIGFKFPDKKK